MPTPPLKRALELAKRGQGWASPNPMVGAVIVKNNKIIGEGWHTRFGKAHAEVEAIQNAKEDTKDATIYVTLEPCNHHGQTPPCTEAIIKAGIKEVIIGTRDPHVTSRGGFERLQAAGLTVSMGNMEEECRELIAPFLKTIRTKTPLVSAKWAMSLDGHTATSSGDSKWITSKDARLKTHQLRAEHDAVLVGIGTVLADKPQLNARPGDLGGVPSPSSSNWQPRRIILDSRARTPLQGPLWDAIGGPIIVFVSKAAEANAIKALEANGAQVIQVTRTNELLDVSEILTELTKLGVLSLFIEGGSEVLGSFFDAHQVDRVFSFIAPKIIGGRNALAPVGGQGAELVEKALSVTDWQLEMLEGSFLAKGQIGTWDWMKL